MHFGPLDCAAVDTVAFGASKPRMEICAPRRAHLVLMRKASKELRPKELNDDDGERSESPRSPKTCPKKKASEAGMTLMFGNCEERMLYKTRLYIIIILYHTILYKTKNKPYMTILSYLHIIPLDYSILIDCEHGFSDAQ